MGKSRKFQLHDGRMGAAITIRVIPGADTSAIGGVQEDGTIQICINVPHEDGKMNQALIGFLSKLLGCARKDIQILAGETGLDKLVVIEGIEAEAVHRVVMAEIS